MATLTFSEPDGTTFEVVLVRAGTRAGLPSATFELDVATWDRVESHGAFHADPGRAGGRARSFHAARPVQVEAVLDPVAAVDGADGLEERLREARPGHPLLSADAWWALSATQDVPMAGSGTLEEGVSYAHPSWLVDTGSTGLSDAWSRALELGDHRDVDPSEPLLGLARAVFEDEDWVVERPDPTLTALRVPVVGADGMFDLWIRTDEAAQVVTAAAVLPDAVPGERVPEALLLAARLNRRVAVGAFEVDPDTGVVSFRTGLDVTGDRLSVALLRRMIRAVLAEAASAWARFADLRPHAPN